MKNTLIILLFILLSACKKDTPEPVAAAPIPIPVVPSPNNNSDNDTMIKNFTYLALGDSYTIGQNVLPQENYPNQTISLLKKDSLFGDVKIIATTGWTTFDLKSAIEGDQALSPKYDIVSLLIGVNNQYQGIDIKKYTPAFEELLLKAIVLSGNHPKQVIVLSIPDWGVTPFAGGRNKEVISKEIDAYNAINKQLSEKYQVNYIDITPWTRQAANDPSLLALDGLHPSGKEYARWAEKLAGIIKDVLR
jgi:lysophospholipase L1-like esterase